mmetsp:Transcript_100467/g.290196  ORF Transcript_100467/g.290196 Transcript_100467/m.290196 type:complete len:249 (-) Transcript_100467:1749-2495(-)
MKQQQLAQKQRLLQHRREIHQYRSATFRRPRLLCAVVVLHVDPSRRLRRSAAAGEGRGDCGRRPGVGAARGDVRGRGRRPEVRRLSGEALLLREGGVPCVLHAVLDEQAQEHRHHEHLRAAECTGREGVGEAALRVCEIAPEEKHRHEHEHRNRQPGRIQVHRRLSHTGAADGELLRDVRCPRDEALHGLRGAPRLHLVLVLLAVATALALIPIALWRRWIGDDLRGQLVEPRGQLVKSPELLRPLPR